jgi:uncharacterized membrane protein YoaK (UPF0700 family)
MRRSWFTVEDLVLLIAVFMVVVVAPEDWSWLKTVAVGMVVLLLLTLVGEVLTRISGKGKTIAQRWDETELPVWYPLGVDLCVIVLAILAFSEGEPLAGLLFSLVALVNLCLFASFRRVHP